jgi:hypothetical protein
MLLVEVADHQEAAEVVAQDLVLVEAEVLETVAVMDQLEVLLLVEAEVVEA